MHNTQALLRDLLRRSVLIVEDDYVLAALLSEEFEMSGAEVVGPVASLSDALALVSATPDLDVAVLDVDLHGELVYPIADALLQRHVPFVFVTGYQQTELAEGYQQFPVLTKPVSVHQVMNALIG